MAVRRRYPVCRLTLSVVLYINVSRVWCSYTPPSLDPKDLRGSSVASTKDGCSGPDSCDSITESMCGSFGVCSLSCPGGSRTNFPSQTVLTSSAMCSASQPGSLPAGVNRNNGNYFTNSSDSTTCNVNKTVTTGTDSPRPFSISFWIQGNCSDCTVLRVDELTVKLSGSQLNVNTNTVPSTVTDTGFVHVVLTKRSATMFDVYVDNTANSVSGTTPDFQSDTLVLGPETALTGSDSLLLLDGRFYNDGLTNREIEELFTGTFPSVSLDSECRCPVSQPNISVDGLTCSGGSGSSVRRLTKTFNDIDAVLNSRASSKWVSKATGDVTIMIDLQNSFQVTDVTVTFSSNSSLPTRTEWSFESQGQQSGVDSSRYTLNSTSCRIKSDLPPDYQAFNTTVAEKIIMKFIGRSSGTVQNLIISSVIISGTCDCDGAATACTLPAGSNASYTCTCLNRTEGDHCRSCANGYYREETGFGCTQSCDCDLDGRNPTRNCKVVGGECVCKSNVEGERCDTCKPLTYNITESNPDGCTRSNCDSRGSSSCNNETGECHCRTNVVNSNCSGCKEKHYWTSQTGCLACECDPKGTTEASSLVCDVETGQCACKQNVQDRHCGQCKDEFYGLSMTNPNGCSACQCHMMGTSNGTCDKGSSGQCQCRGDDITNRTCTPSVTKVVPLFGPVAGGTVVTISGHYLVNSSVAIGTTELTATKSDTQLIINTPGPGAPGSQTLTVTWNSSSTLTYTFQFTYKPNPILAAENPTSATAAQSGGCYVTLAGLNLNSVYKPRMMVNASGEASYSDCTPESSGKSMKCATPAVVSLNGSVAPVYVLFDSYIIHQQLNLTLIQDAVINTGLFLEFAPPFEKTITITGGRIGTDCHRRDYRVVIGDDVDCSITSFSETSIECEPPSSTPVTTSIDNRKYKIRLFIGAREVEVGEIYYKQFWLTEYFVYIMVGCGVFIIFLIALLICICVCRRRRSRSRKKQMSEPLKNVTPLTENNGMTVSDEHELIQPARPYTPFPRINHYTNPGFNSTDAEEHDKNEVVNTEYFLHRVEEGIRSKVQACVIGKKNFTVGSVCYATGNHARLVDGSFTARSRIEPMEKLTIKMLKNPLPDSGILSSLYTTALRECLRFKSYDDESLLTINGIGLDKRRFYILYPYMENRTLKDHILDSKRNFVLRQLLELAGQVCEGMEFLSSKDVVHKDLATRNCMLDATGRVKITDAAFSWDFYPNEYMYDNQRDRYLPVRWMAPESLSTGFYDSKSDVWSFGVLMWELMTRGLVPFQDIADQKVQDAIVEGFRLGKPQMLSEDLYELMNSCWHAESEHRPSFVRIQQEISSAMTDRPSMNESLYVNQESMDNFYVNNDEIQQIHNSRNNYR